MKARKSREGGRVTGTDRQRVKVKMTRGGVGSEGAEGVGGGVLGGSPTMKGRVESGQLRWPSLRPE